MKARLVPGAIAIAMLVAGPAGHAQGDPPVSLSEGRSFAEHDGEALYRAICQACHMAQGQGAKGAGSYPALAGDARLVAAGYPVATILYGRKGMPAFGSALSDEQVAQVTNYVRSQLGNHYADVVTPADVRALRLAP